MEDIFSKSEKSETEKNKEMPKIVADVHEKNSLVIAGLCELGINVHFENLEVADFLVNGVAVERKTVSDFLSSMVSKRLLFQLDGMRQYEKNLLIIEGIEEQQLYNDRRPGISANAIRGFLLSIIFEHNVPIIFTKSAEDTSKFLSVLARKEDKEHISLRAKMRTLDKREQMQFILEGFAGIGPASAKKLLEKFGTVRNILCATGEQLEDVIGKKAEIFKILEEDY